MVRIGNVVDGVNNLTAIAQENAADTEETSASVAEVSSIISDIAEPSKNLRNYSEQARKSYRFPRCGFSPNEFIKRIVYEYKHSTQFSL